MAHHGPDRGHRHHVSHGPSHQTPLSGGAKEDRHGRVTTDFRAFRPTAVARSPSPPGYRDTTAPWGMALWTVTVERAKGLQKTDLVGGGDPFVVVRFLWPEGPGGGKEVLTTPVVPSTLDPVWTTGNTFTLDAPVSDAENSWFVLDVYDKDLIGKDTMGQAELKIRSVLKKACACREPEFTMEVPVLDYEKRYPAGKLVLRFSYPVPS